MGTADQPDQPRSPWPIVVLVLLPVIYMLALGPIGGLAERGLIPAPRVEILTVVYLPLGRIDRSTDFFDQPPGSAYIWYLELFQQ